MMENKKDMEMSTIDKNLPRYYKGYDIDELIRKDMQQTFESQEEMDILEEAMDVYYKIAFPSAEEIRARLDQIEDGPSEERSALNPRLPRYYKRYDVDMLLEKIFHCHLTAEERIVLDDVLNEDSRRESERAKSCNEIVKPLIVKGKEIYSSGTII